MIGRIYRHQRVVTLLVSLVMLVVLTIFAISSFNLSSINLRISGNFQQQRFMEATAQQALDQVISTNPKTSVAPYRIRIGMRTRNRASKAAFFAASP